MDVRHELRLGDISDKLDTLIDQYFRHTSNPVSLCQMGELVYLNNIGGHMFVFDCDFVSQPGYLRAVRSRWRDEHLDVKVFVD